MGIDYVLRKLQVASERRLEKKKRIHSYWCVCAGLAHRPWELQECPCREMQARPCGEKHKQDSHVLHAGSDQASGTRVRPGLCVLFCGSYSEFLVPPK